jgi:hypothetical protein
MKKSVAKAEKKAIKAMKKATAAEKEFEATFAYCNQLRVARGEKPLTMEDIKNPPIIRYRKPNTEDLKKTYERVVKKLNLRAGSGG